MAPPRRINPTLFDKLADGIDIEGLIAEQDSAATGRDALRQYVLPNITRFNEEALRLTVRRELAWLLNTTSIDAVEDLTPYPHVQTSVLNYGVRDLAGNATTRRAIQQRGREIRAAIRAFEPRIEERSLMVEPLPTPERENSVTYLISGNVSAAAHALPVKFRTDVENDSAAVTLRD